MSLKQIRLSAQAKEQLIRLKTRTGIGQWNVLCRWAFCLSLRQPTPPAPLEVPADSNVELSWQVFGGEAQELYLALLKERCERFGVHLLRSDQLELAHRFADRESPDKFAGLDWAWDESVPEVAGVLAYLRLRRAENVVRYDHTILIGDLEQGRLESGEPLVYPRRRMEWLMSPMMPCDRPVHLTQAGQPASHAGSIAATLRCRARW